MGNKQDGTKATLGGWGARLDARCHSRVEIDYVFSNEIPVAMRLLKDSLPGAHRAGVSEPHAAPAAPRAAGTGFGPRKIKTSSCMRSAVS